MHEYATQKLGQKSIIIDADDIMRDPSKGHTHAHKLAHIHAHIQAHTWFQSLAFKLDSTDIHTNVLK